MKVLEKFEQNLEYLGFDMAGVAWDLARMPFESDDDRITLLTELIAKQEGTTSGGAATAG